MPLPTVNFVVSSGRRDRRIPITRNDDVVAPSCRDRLVTVA